MDRFAAVSIRHWPAKLLLSLFCLSAGLLFTVNRSVAEPVLASSFILDFSTVHLQSGERMSRTRSDRDLLLNIILGCGIDASEPPGGNTRVYMQELQEICQKTVVKWGDNVSYWIGGNSDWLADRSGDDAIFISSILTQIGQFTGVEFESSTLRRFANMQIVLFSKKDKDSEREALNDPEQQDDFPPWIIQMKRDFVDGKTNTGCRVIRYTGDNKEISKFVLFVDAELSRPDREIYLADCVVRMMGFRSYSSYQPIINFATNPAGGPARKYGVMLDGLRVLEFLYGDWLAPGMTSSEAVRALQREVGTQR